MVGTTTPKVVQHRRGTTFLPGDNRRRVPHQSPICSRTLRARSHGPWDRRSHAILNERGRKTKRSREGSVTEESLEAIAQHDSIADLLYTIQRKPWEVADKPLAVGQCRRIPAANNQRTNKYLKLVGEFVFDD